MNKNSLISTLISNDLNWKRIVEDKNIKIKEDEHFWIFNYSDLDSDFSDPMVQEARGIIIDKKSYDVVCWPFRKFGNYSEGYHDDIDWTSAKVQEKVDGSIIKLWFNRYSRKWQWSTNGMIDANNCDTPSGIPFIKIIKKTENYRDVIFDKLDKNKTYIFELVSKDNMVVVQYNGSKLYHIGTRNNLTGKESVDDIGIIKPKEYDLHSLDDCLKAAQLLNSYNNVEHEGFVVVDKNYNRIKIKSPEYLALHHFANGIFSKARIIEMMQSDDFDKKMISDKFPNWKETFDYYESEMKRVERETERQMMLARTIFKDNNGDRKRTAELIKNNPYSSIMFKSLGNNRTAKELLKTVSFSKYLDLIVDHKG